jgi:hypothetical protein
MFQNVKKRSSRRGWPIHGYVGPNGGGKSLAMVWDTLPSLAAGRPVLSTVRLLDWENPRACDDDSCTHPEHFDWERDGVISHAAAHPLWIPFTDWQQLLDARGMDVLMDEVTGVASSRESHSMPSVVANVLVQMRRSDVVVRWSAPNWMRADKIIRECSQAVTYCRGYLPKKIVLDGEDKAWSQRRMFKFKTYDAADFEDFTVGKREQLQPWHVDWHYGPRSPAFSAYDTYDAVASIGTVSDVGTCLRCSGTRRRHECSCADYQDSKPARRASGGRRASAEPEPSPRLKMVDALQLGNPAE